MTSETQVRDEIDATREQLGQKLDAIGDRVSPGRILERRKDRVADRFRALRERVMGSAEDGTEHLTEAIGAARQAPTAARERTQGNPLAAGAVAFGVGMLASSLWRPTPTERRAAEAAVDIAPALTEGIMETGRDAMDAVKEQASAATDELRASAGDAAHDIVEAGTNG
jgi:ElaB/YqjD/DUF883 family membrane-anchored ribosome-binding protein